MKNENDIVEPEIVEKETAIQRAPLAVTVTDLAALDDKAGLARIEQLGEIINSLRVISLKLTMPTDWVLFKSPDGAITGFLGDSGCDRIKKLWGIQVENLGKMERIEVEGQSEEFAFRITGDGHSKVTGESVYEMEGIRYSSEPYAQQKPEGVQRIIAVQKAARANLDGGITRELAGLKSIPVEELTKAWEGSWKKWEMCAKGRGFGTGDARTGSGASSEHGIDPQDIPHCDVCQKPLVWRSKNKFFGCPTYDKHPETKVIVDLAKAKELAAKKNAAKKRDPGEEG